MPPLPYLAPYCTHSLPYFYDTLECMKIIEVTLKNFRTHENFTFTPPTQGITALVGDTGKGKSSIIDSIAWALYGTKNNPTMKNTLWKRDGASKDDECYVDVTVQLDDGIMKVHRWISTRGTIQCDVYMNNEVVAGSAVSHAQEYITRTLGIDENGFLSTAFVQQKHVDELVSATPSVRRTLLEKLTGITALTHALNLAKDDEKMYTQALGAASHSTVDIYDLEEQKKPLQARIDDTNAKIDSMRPEVDNLNIKGREATARMKELESLESTYYEQEKTLSVLKAQEKSLMERQDEIMAQQAKLKAKLPQKSISGDMEQELREAVEKTEEQIAQVASRIAVLDSLIEQSPTDKDKEALDDEIREVQAQDTLTKRAIKTLLTRIDTLTHDKAKYESLVDDYQDKVKLYTQLKESDSHENITCPTCLQPIHNINHVVDEFTRLYSEACDDVKKTSNKLMRAQKKYDDNHAIVSQLITLHSRADDMGQQIEERDKYSKERRTLQRTLTSLEQDKKAHAKTLRAFDTSHVLRAQYDSLIDSLSTVSVKLTEVQTQITTLESSRVGFNPSQLKKVRSVVDKLRARHNELKEHYLTYKNAIDTATVQLNSLDERITQAREEQERYNALVQKKTVSVADVKILTAFKQQVIADSIPHIVEYASDLLSTMSDGVFTRVIMDNDFTLHVERNTGAVFAIGQLSGGETSLVAICLRLAISMNLSHGVPQLLILDEIVTAMDDDKTQAIMDTMSDLSHECQIIIVAHNPIIKSIADTVVEL